MVVDVQVTEAHGLGRVRERVIRGECPSGCELAAQDFARPVVLIKFKGTDAAGVFRMGQLKVEDLDAWRAERSDWRDLTVTVLSEGRSGVL
jgi:hypothetical protein